MSSDDFEQKKKAEMEALGIIRNSFFLFGLVELAFVIVAIIIAISSVFSALIGELSTYENDEFVFITFAAIASSMNAFFIFLFLFQLNRGVENLEYHMPDLKMMKYGIIMYAVFTVLSVPLSVMQLIQFYGSIWISVVVSALIFVALIFIGLGVFRMGEHYRSSDLKIGAILLILLNFIGAFYLYSVFGDLIKKVERRLPPPPIPPWI